MKIKVNVSFKHIKDGCRSSIGNCPISLAIWDACIKIGITPTDVETDGDKMSISFTANKIHFPAQRSVRRFVEKFDDGKTVRPFSFVLTL